MFGIADLHTHTTCSDGAYTPEVLVRKAAQKGIRTLSITDHDTLSAYPEAMKWTLRFGVRLIPGIEITASYEGRDVHLLGYGFDPEDEKLRRFVEDIQQERMERNHRIMARLEALGCSVSWEEVVRCASGGSVGRPHIAQALVESGAVRSYQEAFYRYLHDGGPAYVARASRPPHEVIEAIHAAGGVVVLAHPGSRTLEPDVRFWVEQGIDGIEVWHPAHDQALVMYFLGLARRYGLLVTGGSDFHGVRPQDEDVLGQYGVSYTYLQDLLNKVEERKYAAGA